MNSTDLFDQLRASFTSDDAFLEFLSQKLIACARQMEISGSMHDITDAAACLSLAAGNEDTI